jgi:glycosyltransferase involved in cell wall biosynthesis
MGPRTKRVAHLLGPSRGGIRRHVRYLASNPPPGYETLGVFGPADLRDYFADVQFTAVKSWFRFRMPNGADLMHAHGLEAGTVVLRPRRTPVVLSVHTDIDTQGRTAHSRVVHRTARFLAARADAVIASSERVAVRFPQAHVILPATEALVQPSRSRSDLRSELGTPDDRVVVVTVARLHPDKGLDLFVDAVDESGAEGWICGDGPLREALERRVQGTSVRLLGYRDDVSEILHSADVFALPSVGEAYGIAVAEAIGAGLPVVVSSAGVMSDISRDGGIVVPAGDARAFTDAVTTLVRDPVRRRELAERARKVTLPDPIALVRAIGSVYDEVTK